MNVSFTDIKSINCLAECRVLTHLKLVKTAIDDLKVLRECGDNLLTLDVRHTPLLTLEDAAGCCKLRTLDVGNTSISDLTPMRECLDIENLLVDYSDVESIDCFDDHTSLRLIRNDLSKLSKSDVTDWLMKAKARYEAADKGEELCKVGPGRTRLIFFAAALGDLDTMTDLLDEGADVNERAGPRFQKGNMKLYMDVLRGRTKFFDCTAPAEADRPTPLHYAVAAGQEEMVALLVRRGALPSNRAKLGVRGIEGCTLRAREQDDLSLNCTELCDAGVKEAIFREAYRLVDQKVLDARTYTMNKSSRLLEIMKDPSVLERAEEEFKQYPYPLTRTQQQPMTFPIDYKRSMPR